MSMQSRSELRVMNEYIRCVMESGWNYNMLIRWGSRIDKKLKSLLNHSYLAYYRLDQSIYIVKNNQKEWKIFSLSNKCNVTKKRKMLILFVVFFFFMSIIFIFEFMFTITIIMYWICFSFFLHSLVIVFTRFKFDLH